MGDARGRLRGIDATEAPQVLIRSGPSPRRAEFRRVAWRRRVCVGARAEPSGARRRSLFRRDHRAHEASGLGYRPAMATESGDDALGVELEQRDHAHALTCRAVEVELREPGCSAESCCDDLDPRHDTLMSSLPAHPGDGVWGDLDDERCEASRHRPPPEPEQQYPETEEGWYPDAGLVGGTRLVHGHGEGDDCQDGELYEADVPASAAIGTGTTYQVARHVAEASSG